MAYKTRSFNRNSRPSFGSARPTRRGFNKTNIDPRRYVQRSAGMVEEVPYIAKYTFSDFALDPALKRNVTAKGYLEPTQIQDEAIPLILEGRDVIGLSNTGSGKTAAFGLPTINKMMHRAGKETTLIVAPTRELAMQIMSEIRIFSRGLSVYSAVCVGGESIQRQVSELRRNPHIVIGTPGRLKDLYDRKALQLDHCTTFILDECDQMLDMGFAPAIKEIAANLPASRQSLCFSATITPPIQAIINSLMENPVTVSVRKVVTSQHIDQDVIRYQSTEHKHESLRELLGTQEAEKVLIFGETKFGVQRLADSLSRSGHPAEAIHGNKSQPQRRRALQAFKENKVKVLVATDVAARGLDIPNVSHVINFDEPNNYENYVHRIGRTGRAGKTGIALTFIRQ